VHENIPPPEFYVVTPDLTQKKSCEDEQDGQEFKFGRNIYSEPLAQSCW
jgi:hypothetical protein